MKKVITLTFASLLALGGIANEYGNFARERTIHADGKVAVGGGETCYRRASWQRKAPCPEDNSYAQDIALGPCSLFDSAIGGGQVKRTKYRVNTKRQFYVIATRKGGYKWLWGDRCPEGVVQVCSNSTIGVGSPISVSLFHIWTANGEYVQGKKYDHELTTGQCEPPDVNK
jgi:hypothetical protein